LSPTPELCDLVDDFLESYRTEARLHAINRRFIPSREGILEVLRLCLELLYPGYHGRQDLTDENIGDHIVVLLATLREKLQIQIERCLCYDQERCGEVESYQISCRASARHLTGEFLSALPGIRKLLVLDAQAALDGDPAATCLDEVALAYPGFLAITVHRLAHKLYELGVPLMPRILSEWAHSRTGADIHPAARIGRSFFLDHSTGAVIGETSELGDRVRLYQGVTLGALSLPRNRQGSPLEKLKRHPTLQDEVTIYSNATILGGNTVVGRQTVIGGSVFLTHSVPAGHKVSMENPRLRVRPEHIKKPGENRPDF
jgi:serine O-acetyltransferase